VSRKANERVPENSGTLSNPSKLQRSDPRRSRRAAIWLLGLLLLLWGILVLPSAWRETSRREAYLPQLEAEARLHPLDGPLLALLGGRLAQAGEATAAADAFQRALAAGEQNKLLWINFAAATAAAGEIPRSLADLQIGRRSLPGLDKSDLVEAAGRVQSLRPNPAPFDVARAISPQGPGALVELYSAGSFLNGWTETWGRRHPETSGFTTRERWAVTEPNNADVQRLWALALMRNRRLPEAGVVLRKALALAPESPAVLLAQADWLSATGAYSKATVAYLECLKRKPRWLPALLGVGSSSLETGINGYALTGYKQATEVAPNSAEAWVGLGRAYRKTGADHDNAVVAFRKAQALAPGRTDYYNDYADALRQGVQWAAAEDILRKRIAAAPDDPLSHYLLGMVLLNNSPTPERQAEAETETRTSLRLFPHNPLTDLQLAQILLVKQQSKEAIDLLNDALQQNPFNRNAMAVLARAYRQSGRADLAEKVSKQADLLYKDQQRLQVLEGQEGKQLMNAAIHEEMAKLYERVGQAKKAMDEQSMAQVLRSDPQKAAAELEKFRAARNEALQGK
jgi:tetratricopeptide (TPR) repeat protein